MFEDIGAAVDHADKMLHDLVGRQGESLRAGELFALVDEFQGEVRRVPCGVSKNNA